MTDQEALDLVVSRTGHERFRVLVAENPAYWPVILLHASNLLDGPAPEPAARPTPREGLAALMIARRCRWGSWPACGCSGPRCSIHGREIAPAECLACVRRYGES